MEGHSLKWIKYLIITAYLLSVSPAWAQFIRDNCALLSLGATVKATCYDYDTQKFRYWDGADWQDVPGSGGGGGGTIDGSGASGRIALWLDADSLTSDTGILFDGTTNTITATTFAGALSGNALTASALAANPANCSAGQSPLGVDAEGDVEGCFDVATQTELDTHTNATSGVHGAVSTNTASRIVTRDASGNFSAGTITGNLTGNVTGNASTSTALAANGANCSAGSFPLGVDASGAAESCTDGATQAELDTHTNATTAHSATALNTADRIVLRDGSGNFAAGTITATLSGNASTATTASTATALAADPTNCAAGEGAGGVDESGVAEGCTDYMEEPGSNGLVARTAANTSAGRTITGTAGRVTVSNGDGVSGNPTLDVGTAVALKAEVQAGGYVFCLDAGANDTYTCTVTPTLTAYTAGMVVVFSPNTNNTGAATVNIDSLGAKDIVTAANGTPSDGDLTADRFYTLFYDGTSFRMHQDITDTGGTGITSLGGQTGATQTFGNDTNVTITSSGDNHALGWTGTLAKARQHAETAYYDDASPTFDNNVTGTGGFTGALTGNASTATALAANGANCSAGSSPLGVDASGAVESCFDVATQTELDTHTNATSVHSATATNTGSRIVLRDASGNFAAGTITAALSGNATTSTALAANGANCSAGNAPLGVDASGAVEGCFAVVAQSALDDHAALTSAHSSTSTNTASRIVERDASGNFAAGTITATLSGNASTATALAANGANCSAGQAPLGVDASGAVEGCFTPTTGAGGANTQVQYNSSGALAGDTGLTYNATTDVLTVSGGVTANLTGNVTGDVTGNASTATALAANGANCSVGQAARGVNASGAAEDCFTPTGTAGGSDTQVQFNDGGSAVGGDAGLTYNKTTDILTVAGGVGITSTTVASLGTATANVIKIVSDANGPGDCTEGSGSNRQACIGTGSEWIAIGDGSGSTATLEQVMTAGNSTTKCTQSDPCLLGNGTIHLKVFCDDTNVCKIEPDIAADTVTAIMSGKKWHLRDEAAAANVLTADPADTTIALQAGWALGGITNASDHGCNAGENKIFVTDNVWRKCQDGVVTDLDTGGTAPTLDQSFDQGKVIDGANSLANALQVGDGAGAWCVYADSGEEKLRPCTAKNTRRTVLTNFTDGIYDEEGDADMEVYDPDAASPILMWTYPTAAYRPFGTLEFDALSLVGDGTNCPEDPTAVTINSGPKTFTFICGSGGNGTLEGKSTIPNSFAGGTVLFQIKAIQTAADNNAFNGDVKMQCRGNTEVPSSTWGDSVAVDLTNMTGSNGEDHIDAATAVTPAGTCAGGDTLYVHFTLDVTGTTVAEATLHILSYNVRYQKKSRSD